MVKGEWDIKEDPTGSIYHEVVSFLCHTVVIGTELFHLAASGRSSTAKERNISY
jgi:hypothetical protein